MGKKWWEPGPWSDWVEVDLPGARRARMRSRTYPNAPGVADWSVVPPSLDQVFPELRLLRDSGAHTNIDLDADDLRSMWDYFNRPPS